MAVAYRALAVSLPNSYRWRQLYGGMKAEETKWLIQLVDENARLKRLLGEAEPDKSMLIDLAEGNL